MTCTFPWCSRKPRSVASGLCQTHYEQRRLSKEIQLPIEPLLAYLAKRDLYVLGIDGQQNIGLARADEIACKVLKVHPSDIWGLEWFQLPVINEELEVAA